MEAETLQYSGDSSHEMVGSTFIIKQTLANKSNPHAAVALLPDCRLFPDRCLWLHCSLLFFVFFLRMKINKYEQKRNISLDEIVFVTFSMCAAARGRARHTAGRHCFVGP